MAPIKIIYYNLQEGSTTPRHQVTVVPGQRPGTENFRHMQCRKLKSSLCECVCVFVRLKIMPQTFPLASCQSPDEVEHTKTALL
jgi:hypothetical protein